MATKHLRSFLTLVTALVSMTCIGNAVAARRVPPPPTPVELLAPVANAEIVQNDPALATVCTDAGLNATHGYGFRITFDWTDYLPATKVKNYTLEFHHGLSDPPLLVDTTASTYDYIACNAFVIDTNVSDWHWTVTVVGKGQTVPVQNPESRAFTFSLCRLSNLSPCIAP